MKMVEKISKAALRSKIQNILKRENLLIITVHEIEDELENFFGVPLDTRCREIRYLILKYTRSQFRKEKETLSPFFQGLIKKFLDKKYLITSNQCFNLFLRSELEKNDQLECTLNDTSSLKPFEFSKLPNNNVLRRAFRQ